MSDLNLKFPNGWQLIALAVFGIVTFCAIKWRRHWRGMLAICSFLVLISVGIMLPATWMTSCEAQFVWCSGPEGPAMRWWDLSAECCHGLIKFGLSEDHVSDKAFVTHFSISHDPNRNGKVYWATGPRSLTRDWPLVEKAGFQLISVPPDPDIIRVYAVFIPHYFFLLLCIPFPLIWYRRFRRQRQRRIHNFCLACGFDRQSHQPTDACPECGTIPKPPKTPAAPPPATTLGNGEA